MWDNGRMPSRANKPKRPRDTNKLAKLIVDLSVGEVQEADPYAGKNPKAVESGRLGGQKGGKARSEAMTVERRKAIARKAATARWTKKSPHET
jgi:hypothetical protein